MNKGNKFTTLPAMILIPTFLLTACGSSQNAAAPASYGSTSNVTVPTDQQTTASNATNTGINPITSVSSPPTMSTTTSITFQPSTQLSMLFSQIRDRALEGGVINCPYLAGTTLIDQVKKDWGTANQENAAGEGIYATYSANDVSFGYNKGGQIFDVRNYGIAVKGITLSRLTSEFGQPNQVNHLGGQDVFIYNVSDKFQLQFVMPSVTAQNSNPQMDHYNVYWPKGAVNLMLQP